MRIIKPSKRPRNGQLSSQATSKQDAFEFVTDLGDESNAVLRPTDRDATSDLTAKKSAEPEDQAMKAFNDLMAKGVGLLAMREHSTKEIIDKLTLKNDIPEVVYAVVDQLIEKGYLSDERFTEAYVRSRANRGFGPIKIRTELRNKGVSSSTIDDHLDANTAVWYDNALAQYRKKYGDTRANDYNAWSKRARFMQSRGFTMEHIQIAVPKVDFD